MNSEKNDTSRETLYMRLVRSISDDIKSGRLPIGARLPTEAELRKRFNASRHTVREALRYLREAGFITSRQGSGSSVAMADEARRYVHSATSIDELFRYAAASTFSVTNSGIVETDVALAQRLDSSPGRRWLHVTGLRHVETMDEPICWVEVFIHSSFAKIEKDIRTSETPIYALIEERFGERIVEVRQTLRATTVNESIAQVLDVLPGSPALEIQRTFISSRQKVLEVSFSVHPLGRFSYTMTMRLNEGD
jgi:GntR family transcriptional regulator